MSDTTTGLMERRRRCDAGTWDGLRLATLALLILPSVLLSFDAWADLLYLAWRDEESSHAFLVPVVAAWLVWVRRGRLRYCPPRTSWVGPAIVFAGWMLYSLGDTFLVQSFYHAGAVVMAVGCLITVAGHRLLMDFFPAFLGLAFLVPIPGSVRQQIAVPLQRATAAATQHVFELMGITVERAGNLLSINGSDVAIAEACNGMRMVFALLLVSYAFAFGTPLRWYVRLLVIVATPLTAIACNVIRLVPTVWLYGHASTGTAETFHDLGAWVMLLASFLVLMGILRLMRWAMVPVTVYNLAYD